MFYVVVIILFFLFLLQNYIFLRKFKENLNSQCIRLEDKRRNFDSMNDAVRRRFKELEDKLNETFFVYELARDISPLLEKSKLLDVFKEKLRVFSGFEEIDFFNQRQTNYLNYELKTTSPSYLGIKYTSKRLKEHLPLFLHQLNLCLERIELYNKLQELSVHDSLTQVFNRRYFMDRFYEEFERTKKFAFNLSFLMIDIDNFKSLNDTYGHVTGDVVLREVACILKESVREIDFVARFGGEEFSIILTETTRRDAITVAKRIVKRIASSKLRAFDELIEITVSIGLASYPENSLYPDMLMEIADRALYKAKESGRNIVSWF